MLDQFTLIPTPLPPMLASMAGFSLVDSRYISIAYLGNKATWSDGRSLSTVSYYGCYEPLISHMALACYLWNYHLGSDDDYPTHSLLCDRQENKLYVGEVKAVEQLLNSQHPPVQSLTKEQWEEAKKLIESMPPPSLDELRQQGMFEMFGNISPEQQQQKIELVQWLDQQISKELIERYIAEARAGNYNAVLVLDQLKARVEKGLRL